MLLYNSNDEVAEMFLDQANCYEEVGEGRAVNDRLTFKEPEQQSKYSLKDFLDTRSIIFLSFPSILSERRCRF